MTSARRSSPRLLPPRGGRENFGFQAAPHPPPPPQHTHRPSIYIEDPLSTNLWPSLSARPPPPQSPAHHSNTLTNNNDDIPDEQTHLAAPSNSPGRETSSTTRTTTSPTTTAAVPRCLSPFLGAEDEEFLSPRPTRAAALELILARGGVGAVRRVRFRWGGCEGE